MRKMVGLALAASLVLAAPAAAQNVPEEVVSILYGRGAATPIERMKVATYLRREYQSFNANIPSLSPSQVAWLKAEYDDQIALNGNRFNERSVSASNSTEFAIRIAKGSTLALISILDRLERQINDPIIEMKEWLRVVEVMIDLQYSQSLQRLAKANIIPSKSVGDFFYENNVLRAQYVIRNIMGKI